jgi:hypothetical protein
MTGLHVFKFVPEQPSAVRTGNSYICAGGRESIAEGARDVREKTLDFVASFTEVLIE